MEIFLFFSVKELISLMQKTILRLNLQEHRGIERIFAHYPYHATVNKILRDIPELNTA